MVADVYRYEVLALGGIVAVATVVVLVLYFLAWRRAPAGRKLLPAHVFLIAGSHLGTVIAAGWAVFGNLGTDRPLGGYAALFAVSSLTGIAALVTIAIKQWHGLGRGEPEPEAHTGSHRA